AGKTTLARELCLRRKGRRRVVHLNCEGGGDLIAALAAALGARRSATPASAVLDALASRRTGTLVVLDGLEEIPPEFAALIPGWLDAAPLARLLLTSTRFPPLAQARCWETRPL